MWTVARQLFDAPLADKQAVNVAKSTNNRGYFSSIEHAEFNKDPEGIHIKDNKEVGLPFPAPCITQLCCMQS